MLGAIKLDKWFDPWTCSNCGFHGADDDSGNAVCEECSALAVEDEESGEDRCPECTASIVSSSCPSCEKSHCWSRDYGHRFENPFPELHWVVVGGESGENARPMHPAWALNIRNQCKRAAVPFLFKQWGEFAPISSISSDKPPLAETFYSNAQMHVCEGGERVYRVGKKRAGRLLDGVLHDGYPAQGESA